MKEFFKQAISKDERFVSILVLFAVLFTVIDVFLALKNGDIPTNLLTLTIWLYGFVAANSSIPEVVEKLKAINGKE